MRHGNYQTPFFIGWDWIFVLIIVLAVIIIYFILRKSSLKRDEAEKGLNKTQAETIENFSTLVSAMLAQHGSGLKQQDISKNLGLPSSVTAEKLLQMEKSGEISREWINDEYTFVIKSK